MKKSKIYSLWILCILITITSKAQESNTVVDGKARFTVLTPTLIRTEYTGDSIFESKNSFNIINLNLPTPSYSTTVNGGWREIQTEKLLLRYKQNSGVFESSNFSVTLNSNSQTVISKPWISSLLGYKYEAENATLLGGAISNTDHLDYSGLGFVAGLEKVGAGMQWKQNNNLPAGEYAISLRYCNGMGVPRTISLYIDNVKTQIVLANTLNWDSWSTFKKTVILGAGSHTFMVSCDQGDSFNVNIDWIAINPVLNLNQICEAENVLLAGGATKYTNHNGFTGSGFVAGLEKLGAEITWDLNNKVAAGDYTISLKYANGVAVDGKQITRTISLYIDDVKTRILLLPTTDWDSWGIFKKTVTLGTGDHTFRLSCEQGDNYNVNIDWLAVSPVGADLPKPAITEGKTNLGGWLRSLDTRSGAIPLWDGLMSKDGWYLIDDSQTALTDANGWVVARPHHTGGYQDGYFFGYGTDYQTGLSDFYKITGNPPLLPKWAFGVWISKYEAYGSSYFQNTLLPKFRSEKLPIDMLVIDTDWKSPGSWNGWNWSTPLFPNPQDFMDWTKVQGLKVALNIHPSINKNDPKNAQANITAGGLVEQGDNSLFDFSNRKHVQAYFDLHQPFNKQGVRSWWMDWCCEGANASIVGLPVDTWINSLYAKDAINRGLRGFAFSRIGSGYNGYGDIGVPGMAWSDHRYTLHFTGDTYATWDMLAFESTYTILQANIGIPYVSHDLGSFKGQQLSDDMYLRWVQFGTFQPIFRLHSDHGMRLPWEYPNVTKQAESFIRLRHALVPYTYTLAQKSSIGGMPIVRGMYFYYPNSPEAYSFDKQYFYGDKVLVSPVITPGANATTKLWFPEGKWTSFFTNEIVIGPIVKSVSSDYNTMPVFVKAGGIIPLASYSDFVGQNAEDSLTLKVYTGDDGEFTLYEDEGENLNYQTGKSASTKIVYDEIQRKLSIKARQGNYTGATENKSYNIELYNAATPQNILLNGTALKNITGDSGEGWWINNSIIYIHLNKIPVTADYDLTLDGYTNLIPIHTSTWNIKLYPNPTTNMFTLELNDACMTSIVTIYNGNGEKVFDKNITNSKKTVINTHLLSKGAYHVNVENGNSRFTEKLIIK